MRIIPSRQLAASPGKVWSLLKKEGALVITRSGIPCGILLPTSEATLVEDLREETRRRAKGALSSVRRRARETGKDELSGAEIAAEVAAVRGRRKTGGR
jgi:hypothetical protein